MIDSNPAEDFGLAAPPPRNHVWDEDGGHADDEPMGIIVTQGKTSKPVGIPILRPLRTRIEAAFEANAKATVPSPMLFLDEDTGLPWKKRKLTDIVKQARETAINPSPEAIAKGLAPPPAGGRHRRNWYRIDHRPQPRYDPRDVEGLSPSHHPPGGDRHAFCL
jgi:hypothetical protein